MIHPRARTTFSDWLPGCLLALLLVAGRGVPVVAADSIPATPPATAASFGMLPATIDPAIPESRSYFVFNTMPGAVLHPMVRVLNSGTAAGTARLYSVDSRTSDTTGATYGAMTDAKTGVGAWVAISRDTAELPLGPGEERAIPFTIIVPTDARGGQYLGGLVAENVAPVAAVAGSANISIVTRAVLAVQINLPGDRIDTVVASGVTPGGENGDQTLTFALRNDGNALIKPQGNVTVTRHGTGQPVQTIPVKMDTFVPGTAIHYPAYIQGQALDAGDYDARLDLTYGTGGELHYTGQFSVTPQQLQQTFGGAGRAPLAPPTAFAGANPAAKPGNVPSVGPGSIFGTVATPLWVPLVAGGLGMVFLLTLAVAGAFALGRRGGR